MPRMDRTDLAVEAQKAIGEKQPQRALGLLAKAEADGRVLTSGELLQGMWAANAARDLANARRYYGLRSQALHVDTRWRMFALWWNGSVMIWVCGLVATALGLVAFGNDAAWLLIPSYAIAALPVVPTQVVLRVPRITLRVLGAMELLPVLFTVLLVARQVW